MTKMSSLSCNINTPLSFKIVTLVLTGSVLLLSSGCANLTGDDIIPDTGFSDVIEIYFFYEEFCDSCEEDFSIFEVFNEKVADVSDLHSYRLNSLNVARLTNRTRYEELVDRYGHLQENLAFPLLMVNNKLIVGEDSIRSNIREAFLAAGKGD